MAIEFTDVDLQELALQAQQQGEGIHNPIENGIQAILPKRLGEGSECFIKLRDGLTIAIRKGRFCQNIRHFRQHEAIFDLTAKFYLSGMSRVQTLDATDIDTDYEEVKGCHYLYHLPNQTEVEEWPTDELIHVVYVSVDPNYFSTFDTGKTVLSPSLQQLIDGNRTQRFHQPLGKMTPSIKHLLQQILHCPYTGLMQQIYLESKALELFAAQFSLWSDVPPTSAIALCAQEIEQLHQAREILIQQAVDPPSLMTLARQVGLNDRKLNRGFRHLFGTTVFSYLQNHRLQQAQELLRSSGLTIASVAARVGYRSPEAFSTAFRRKFAVSPKTYQLSQQR